MVSQVKQELIKTRTESVFKEIISNAKTVAEEVDAKLNFLYLPVPVPEKDFLIIRLWINPPLNQKSILK